MKKQVKRVLPQSQFDESHSSSADSEYIKHLKSQCTIRYNALKTAENLIQAYQKENELLKADNESLSLRLQMLEGHSQNARELIKEVETLRRNAFKASQRINELLEGSIQKDRRIDALEKEMRELLEKQESWKRLIQDRQRRKQRGERKKKVGEEKFQNFLKLPVQESFNSSSSKSTFNRTSLQMLQVQVKRKDAEIMTLLRRLRDVQEELKHQNKKERMKTSDTAVNHSIRKNTYSSIDEE